MALSAVAQSRLSRGLTAATPANGGSNTPVVNTISKAVTSSSPVVTKPTAQQIAKGGYSYNKTTGTWGATPTKTTTTGLVSPSTQSGLKVTASVAQTNNKNIFGDVGINANRETYTGKGMKTSQGNIITDFSKPMDMPKELDIYGQKMREYDKANQGALNTRNDTITYNLKSSGIDNIQGIGDYLAKQAGFKEATPEEQHNTINSIAARMGISATPPTPQELLAEQQTQLFDNYTVEQNKLIAEGNSQDVVKRMDNLLGKEIRNLTDTEIQKIATETGLTPEDVKNTTDQRSLERQRMADPFQQKEQDLKTENERNVSDAQLQLQRTQHKIEQNIADITTNMERDVAGDEKVGALKGYVQSSGYMQGIQNVKTDAQKLIDRQNELLADATTDTATYVNRNNTDYSTNLDRVQKSFNDDLLNLRLAGTNEVNTLLTKYSPSDKLMKKELERLNDEYGMKSMNLYKSFLENFKGITDAAMYETEKIQTYQTKQRELENLTLSQLYANDGAALMNMTDSSIQDLADKGYIRQDQVAQLKAGREGVKQQFALKQTASSIDLANLKITQQKANAATGIFDSASFVESINQIPNGVKGGQCAEFVNNILEAAGVGRVFAGEDQSLAAKVSKVNSYTPTIGSVLVRSSTTPAGQKYGDVVIVAGVNGDQISYKGSNKAGEEMTYTGTINAKDQSIKGYFDPAKVKKTNSQLTDDQRAMWNASTSKFLGNQVVKDFEQLYGQLQNSVSSLGAESGPGDIAAVYQFMKVLDPSSVVRETEFATAAKSAGVISYIGNTFNRLENGEVLTSKQREAFAKLMQTYTKNKASSYNRIYGDMTRQLKASGIPQEYRPNNATEGLDISYGTNADGTTISNVNNSDNGVGSSVGFGGSAFSQYSRKKQ